MGRTSSSGSQVTGENKAAASSLTPLKFTIMFSLPFSLVFVLLLAALMVWERNTREKGLVIEMRETARAYFEQIVITRHWNADQGSVYVQVTGKIQPNPYLKDDPRRDIVTQDGSTYTKINPDFMTRQISDLAISRGNYRFRATSLRPLNPQNSPDSWETAQLTSFEKDKKTESYDIIADGGEKKFRYMAPLLLDEACLMCHWKQGYSAGDVGGGISIDIPMDIQMQSSLAMTRRDIASMSIIGITALCSIIGITWIFSKKIVQGINQQMERQRLETTINLAGEAAQEIRQPLAVISGLTQLLMSKALDEESCQEKIDTILQECWKIDGIIRKMPNITTFQAGPESEGMKISNLHARTPGSEERPSPESKP